MPSADVERRLRQSRRPGGRGLTLLEILIILAILALVAAGVVPLLDRVVSERRFERGMDSVSGLLLAARLEALERSRPVEVIFRRPILEVRLFDAEGSGLLRDPEAFSEFASEAGTPEAPPLDDRRLSPDLLIAPETEADDPTSDPPDPATVPTGPVRLVIFLPDGTAVEDRGRRLQDADGRRASIRIDSRTGLAEVRRDRSPTDEGSKAVDADDSRLREPSPEEVFSPVRERDS